MELCGAVIAVGPAQGGQLFGRVQASLLTLTIGTVLPLAVEESRGVGGFSEAWERNDHPDTPGALRYQRSADRPSGFGGWEDVVGVAGSWISTRLSSGSKVSYIKTSTSKHANPNTRAAGAPGSGDLPCGLGRGGHCNCEYQPNPISTPFPY